MKTVAVSAMEYEALLNLERMIRMALTNPDMGEFLLVAVQALDAVREQESKVEQPSKLVSTLIESIK